MFPSMTRVLKETGCPSQTKDLHEHPYLTLRLSRLLYDWYVQERSSPIVIDADDVMNNRSAIHQLCLTTGLDPKQIKYAWE